jgi:hypothetical protein
MSCCSDRRQAVSTTPQLRVAVAAAHSSLAAAAPSAAGSAANPQRLRYVGHAPLNVRGPFSARIYEVDVLLRLIDADARDVSALLRTALFERAA